MTNPIKVLVITKTTKWSRLSDEEKERIPLSRAEELEGSHKRHVAALEHLKTFTESDRIQAQILTIEQITDGADLIDFEYIITLGGDGTVLFASKFVKDEPVFALNSDSKTSVGRLCRDLGTPNDTWSDNVEIAFGYRFNWGREANSIRRVKRLKLVVDGKEYPFLNDVLLTNENPAEMSVYRFIQGCEKEVQYSSGMWIAGPAGSTGGIQSAGVTPVDLLESVMLWKVREPYEGRGRCWNKEGYLPSNAMITLEALNEGMVFYVDGSRQKIPLAIGVKAYIMSYEHDLRLV